VDEELRGRSYIPEKKPKGRLDWQGQHAEQQAVYEKRRRGAGRARQEQTPPPQVQLRLMSMGFAVPISPPDSCPVDLEPPQKRSKLAGRKKRAIQSDNKAENERNVQRSGGCCHTLARKSIG
jgi:hypothetical protein